MEGLLSTGPTQSSLNGPITNLVLPPTFKDKAVNEIGITKIKDVLM